MFMYIFTGIYTYTHRHAECRFVCLFFVIRSLLWPPAFIARFSLSDSLLSRRFFFLVLFFLLCAYLLILMFPLPLACFYLSFSSTPSTPPLTATRRQDWHTHRWTDYLYETLALTSAVVVVVWLLSVTIDSWSRVVSLNFSWRQQTETSEKPSLVVGRFVRVYGRRRKIHPRWRRWSWVIHAPWPALRPLSRAVMAAVSAHETLVNSGGSCHEVFEVPPAIGDNSSSWQLVQPFRKFLIISDWLVYFFCTAGIVVWSRVTIYA